MGLLECYGAVLGDESLRAWWETMRHNEGGDAAVAIVCKLLADEGYLRAARALAKDAGLPGVLLEELKL